MSNQSGRIQNVDAKAPIAVIMRTLNEAHNMEAVLKNLSGWAQEVFVVDSYSQDDTVSIALRHGAHVVQRKFRGFGDQWNFALNHLPISAPWTMKLDPDERLTDELKASIKSAIAGGSHAGYSFDRRLWFMGKPLPVKQEVLRIWKTGACKFSDVSVNEHPLVTGSTLKLLGLLEHHDSPDLTHWLDKQNHYSFAEALAFVSESALSDQPKLFVTPLQRRMWFKRNFYRLPFRYTLFFIYNLLFQGAWRAGRIGWIWARLRSDVMRLIAYKALEIRLNGNLHSKRPTGPGSPDPRVQHYD